VGTKAGTLEIKGNKKPSNSLNLLAFKLITTLNQFLATLLYGDLAPLNQSRK